MSAIAPVPPVLIAAYWEKETTSDLLVQVAADPRMARGQMRLSGGGIPAALEDFAQAPTPDLLLIETVSERADLLLKLDALADVCDAGTKLVVIGSVNDIVLYRELMARGVSEYIVHPFSSADLVRLVAGLYAHPAQRLVGRVIAVCGAKGGAGASTLAHNLAAMIARETAMQVILADMDIPFGTAGLALDQEPVTTLADAMEGGERVDTNFVERLLTRCDDYLSLVASPALVEAAHDVEAAIFDPALDAMRAMAPFIVLDLPYGWPDWKQRVLLSAEEIVLVAEPDLANLRNAKNIFDFLRSQRPDDLHPHFILNHAGQPKRPEIPVDEFAKALERMPAAIIAHDARLFGTAANSGQLAMDQDGSARFSQALRPLALSLAGRSEMQISRFPALASWLVRLRQALG